MMAQSQMSTVLTAVNEIPEYYFTAYRGGWKDEISTSLIDAAFSMRSTYRAKDPTKGVLGRVKTFRDAFPRIKNDLSALTALGSTSLSDIMGSSKTSGRLKSDAAIEAARRFLEAEVSSAEGFLSANSQEMKRIYTSVRGLGPVTFEYFSMLLGRPGVKADRMIVRFVNNSLKAANISPVTAKAARIIIIEAYSKSPRGETLTHFDHAIWRFQSDLVKRA